MVVMVGQSFLLLVALLEQARIRGGRYRERHVVL